MKRIRDKNCAPWQIQRTDRGPTFGLCFLPADELPCSLSGPAKRAVLESQYTTRRPFARDARQQKRYCPRFRSRAAGLGDRALREKGNKRERSDEEVSLDHHPPSRSEFL